MTTKRAAVADRAARIDVYRGYTITCAACDLGPVGVTGDVECSRETALYYLREHNADKIHRENVKRRRRGEGSI